MKKIFATIIALTLCGITAAQAQRFAYADVDSVMRALPSYAEAQASLATIRAQYEQEIQYNEQSFQRQFAEFLNGQKTFPEAILLKRQGDLQVAMERGLAFRRECDRLLKKAEDDMLQPIRQRITTALTQISQEHGYAFVMPTQPLYANPALCDDITPLIISRLIGE